MLCPLTSLNNFRSAGINFYTGVPDSLLKPFCDCITDKIKKNNHIIAANEGSAIGLAIGKHIATNEIPLVYMQNSGLGNAVNPLLSLASSDVYGIPIILMIGWRGEPGVKDEPQHKHQGKVTISMLECMDIPYILLSEKQDKATEQIKKLVKKAKDLSRPVAIVVKKELFSPYTQKKATNNPRNFLREKAIVLTAEKLGTEPIIVCTTGMASRELFEYRTKNKLTLAKDFLTVGGMGHASQIALGLAMSKTHEKIVCFDGDGAVLMHMGSLPIIGQSGCTNFLHIVFNNGVHDSVGGQPTVSKNIDLPKIAIACGYSSALTVSTQQSLIDALDKATNIHGPNFIEVIIDPGNRADVGRPTTTPKYNKQALMKSLG